MKIKWQRFLIMWVAALAVLGWYFVTDPNGGAETIARLQWLAWLVVVSGPVYMVRKALMPGDGSQAWAEAINGNMAAGIAWAGMAVLTGLLFLAFAGRAQAADLPIGAQQYLPLLSAEMRTHWPAVPVPAALAAQVEQETCASLKSKRCWNPTTELKTAREYGFGLGQITITSRFDNFKEARKLDQSLRDWQFADRYDPAKQLRTMVLMDRGGFQRLVFVADPQERLAMALAGYNGGIGGVLSDRRVCANLAGCDPGRWFGHVEKTSLKSRTKWQGYGKSAFEINREYVRNVLVVRRAKYDGLV